MLKMLLIDCTINIHIIISPDTGVLILVIRCYPELCLDSNFITRVGEHGGRIKVCDINTALSALGPSKTATPPGLHALSGCINTVVP